MINNSKFLYITEGQGLLLNPSDGCRDSAKSLMALNGRPAQAPRRQLSGEKRSRQPVNGAAESDPKRTSIMVVEWPLLA
jgi:hypothetical protein